MSFFRRAGALIARFFTSTIDPGAAAGEFQLYNKADGNGVTQLFGRSDNGTVHQITPSAAGDSSCLIFKPGSGETGPVIFDTWVGLYTQLTALRAAANGGGCYTIQFDGSAGADIFTLAIPAGAYDMTDVTWEGTLQGNPISGSPPTFLSITEGATFTGGPSTFQDLSLFSRATATVPFTYTNGFTDVIKLLNTNIQAETAPIPVFRATGGGVPFFQLEFSTLGDDINPVCEVDAASGANLRLGVGSSVRGNALITLDDGGFGLTFEASSSSYSENQPLAPGAALAPDDDDNNTFSRHFTTDIQTVDANVSPGELSRFNAGVDPLPIAQLPQALLSDNRYKWVLIKETSGQPSSSGEGNLGVVIQPFAGDSIDGVLGPALLLPGSQVAYISRGDGNWNSAWKTAGVPEKVFASVVINPNGGIEKRVAYFNVGNTTPGSGVVKNATGDWTITFDNPFPTGYYPMITFGLRDQGLVFANYQTIDNSNIQILTYNAAGVLTDPNNITVMVHLAPEIGD